MNTISVSIRNVYGNELIYPACDKSRAFAKLKGQKTLTPADIRIIQDELGFKVGLTLGTVKRDLGF